MGARVRIVVPLGAVLGFALIGIGAVYLAVACENLPGFLGPHAGDTSPRVGLGVTAVVLGTISLLGVLIALLRSRN